MANTTTQLAVQPVVAQYMALSPLVNSLVGASTFQPFTISSLSVEFGLFNEYLPLCNNLSRSKALPGVSNETMK